MIIAVLSAALAAIVVVAILLAIIAVLLVVIVVFFSDKFKSPTDWYFSTMWRIGKIGLFLTAWLWGYFFKALV